MDHARIARKIDEHLERGAPQGARRELARLHQHIDDFAEVGPAGPAKALLGSLRDHAMLDELEALGRKVREHLPDEAWARLACAQALIESKKITEAIADLKVLASELEQRIAALPGVSEAEDASSREQAQRDHDEACGILGRAYKQLYIDARPNATEPREHDVEQAIEWYRQPFVRDPRRNHWHGINLAALQAHRERTRRGQPGARSKDARETAERLLSILEVDARDEDGWLLADRAEALLALGRNQEAIEAFRAYLERGTLTRFMVQGTLRQLRELWGLTEDRPPGDAILRMMTARLAGLPGATVQISPDSALEGVFGSTSYQPIKWLLTALQRASCVARIGTAVDEGIGTGFLLDGKLIGPQLEGKPLLLTNAHVCTGDADLRDRLRYQVDEVLAPERARAFFFFGTDETAPILEGIPVVRQLFTSPPEEFDATLLELASMPPGRPPIPLAADPVDEDDRVNIIGHPEGKGMAVSLQDNLVVEVKERFLRYTTPTYGGSSGSPVFDQKWELVGLHHAARRGMRANEGISMLSLLPELRRELLPG